MASTVTAYATSKIGLSFSFKYRGPSTNVVCWFALVGSDHSTPVAGPDGHHQATGATNVPVNDGDTINVTPQIANNGSIPGGSFDVRAVIFNSDWSAALYSSQPGEVGTVNVVPQATQGVGFGLTVS